MSVQVEKLEKNTAKLTIETSADAFAKALKDAYNKNKSRFQLPGFRKGKVPMNMVVKAYGEAALYEDAIDALVPAAYSEAVKENELTVVSQPVDFEVVQIGSGKSFIFSMRVALKPEVTLGEYKGLTVKKADLTVTEDEVMAEIKKEQEKNAVNVPVERAAEMGDIATIDFEGFVDGVAFNGGKGTEYPLTLGSGSFIPGFEEQVAGHAAGEAFDVNVTFPEQYQAAELAGKDATFKVVLHKVEAKELPELDDEFASEVSEFETMDEYKASVAKKLADDKAAEAKRAKMIEALEKAVSNASMELSDLMIADEAHQMMNEQEQNMRAYGISMEQYMQMTGQTAEQMEEQMKPQAELRIKNSLVLEAIAEAEKIEVTEEEINAELEKAAEQYNMTADDLRKMGYADALKNDMRLNKAQELIADAAVEEA